VDFSGDAILLTNKKAKKSSAELIRDAAKKVGDKNSSSSVKNSFTNYFVPNKDLPDQKKTVERDLSNINPLCIEWGRYKEVKISSCVLVTLSSSDDLGEEAKNLIKSLGLFLEGSLLLTQKKNHQLKLSNSFKSQLLEKFPGESCELIVFDSILSPSEIRKVEDLFDRPVFDRRMLILEIFNRHATSKLSRMQVELARSKFLLTRLAGIWEGLSRQRGAKGGLGGRGLGEKKLELDRRHLRDRIQSLEVKITKSEKSFHVQSSRRSQLPRLALVGYTNSGKSTLMNALTQAKTLEKDKLFSTLDTLVRALSPPTKPTIIISDTVGFIRDLPVELVASFRSTLLEALEADVIIHVLDASQVNWEQQFNTTEEVLKDLKSTQLERIFVVNKVDLQSGFSRFAIHRFRKMVHETFPGAPCLLTSALTGQGVPELRKKIIELSLKLPKVYFPENFD